MFVDIFLSICAGNPKYLHPCTFWNFPISPRTTHYSFFVNFVQYTILQIPYNLDACAIMQHCACAVFLHVCGTLFFSFSPRCCFFLFPCILSPSPEKFSFCCVMLIVVFLLDHLNDDKEYWRQHSIFFMMTIFPSLIFFDFQFFPLAELPLNTLFKIGKRMKLN